MYIGSLNGDTSRMKKINKIQKSEVFEGATECQLTDYSSEFVDHHNR